MLPRAAKHHMSHYRVEIRRWTGEGWMADSVVERELARGATQAFWQVLAKCGWKQALPDTGCYRVDVFGPLVGECPGLRLSLEAEPKGE